MTVRELAHIRSAPNAGDQLEAALSTAIKVLTQHEACVNVEILRGVEDPEHFVMQVEWVGLEEHQAFRDSELLDQYREQVKNLVGQPTEFSHFRSTATAQNSRHSSV